MAKRIGGESAFGWLKFVLVIFALGLAAYLLWKLKNAAGDVFDKLRKLWDEFTAALRRIFTFRNGPAVGTGGATTGGLKGDATNLHTPYNYGEYGTGDIFALDASPLKETSAKIIDPDFAITAEIPDFIARWMAENADAKLDAREIEYYRDKPEEFAANFSSVNAGARPLEILVTGAGG